MKLGDLFTYISDADNIAVWYDGEIVAEYDGKNSIDAKWNGYEVDYKGISCHTVKDINTGKVTPWIDIYLV